MIGVDISDKSIKIAEVTGRSNPQLRTVCWSALAPNLIRRGVIQDIGVATAALQDAFTKCSPGPVTTEEVVASIPETQSFVRVLDLPEMSDRETEEAVQWAVRQHIPFDLDRVYLDWQPLPTSLQKKDRIQLLVGAVQKDVVDPLLQVLDGAGLHVVALELEAQAIARSLLPNKDAFDVHGVLIIDLGATSTNIIFFDEGTMKFTASVQIGGDDLTQKLAHILHITPDMAAEKKALVGVEQNKSGDDATVAVALHEAAIDLLRRIEKTVREMAAQFQSDHFVRAILLSGGSANLPGLRGVVAEVFPGIPIEIGNPWTNIYFDSKEKAPLSPQDASHFITALGLALREPETL
ncbi:MAG: type IV pilus assembly protein PilM [Candidatus Andersenbacteria bacterium]